MTNKKVRKIVKIDEEKCDGCAACVPSCAEGAIQIIDGKAKLVSEVYCDGLGACLGECPQGAITIEEREAEEFDEEAVDRYLDEKRKVERETPCSCPSAIEAQFNVQEKDIPESAEHQASMLTHWPVQLALVQPAAPFFRGADLLLSADCVPFAFTDFHRDFLKSHALLIACPKLDDYKFRLQRLTDILSQADIKSLTVVRMEVPCCAGLTQMAEQAISLSGKEIPFKEVVVGIRGDIKF